MTDPITLGIATKAGEEVVKAVAKSIEKRTNKIDKAVSDGCTIEGREIVIECPESIQKYSISLVPKKQSIVGKKVKLEFGIPRAANIKQVRSLQNVPNALKKTPKGIELNLKTLQEGELYILDVEYEIEDPNFIDSLVDRHKPKETPSSDQTEYWMVAQLKHVKTLKERFNRLDIRDIDFGVDVAVHQDINLRVPGIFKQHLTKTIDLLRKTGRGQKHKDFMAFLTLQKQKFGGREFEILGEIQEVFLPSSFRRFVEVEREFRYHDSVRGSDFYDSLPIPTWPKSMKVISRTDLTFERPASDGILRYKRKEFTEEIESVFE